jgi:DNA-binding NarL/FixJ family response regulator
MLRHRRQHDRVRLALRDEQRHAEPAQHVVAVDLAQRARLDLTPPDAEPDREESLADALGLTPREAEVLALVARGYKDREIAEALVISVKTASVHVSHILGKLGVPNRREAAAIAHRLAPPPVDV